ncbi:MAG: hypothetical protein OXR72_09705 [Gemmatimonadota bacterium]|nr:hypothetical protein [Gemmatimonadota bacterium]
MTISFRCPECQAVNDIQASRTAATCQACGRNLPLDVSKEILNNNLVDVCPRCGKTDFYVQRDFNGKIGLGIAVLFALVGLVFVALDRPVYFYACLAAAAIVDLALYLSLPEITICYSCKTAFRGARKNPTHQPFDLHTADMYDHRAKG